MSHIVEQARSWLGTKYQHQGRLKHKGCDCIGFILGVAEELDLKSINGQKLKQYDKTDYARIPDGQLLYQTLASHLQEVAVSEMQAGDMVLMRFRKDPQHLGILTDYHHGGLGLIHCYAEASKVVEHRFDPIWHSRLVAAFRFAS